MKVCVNCATENPDDAVVCTKCGMGLARAPSGDEALKLKAELEEMLERAQSLILTTGFEVEGRPIREYLSVVSSEVVMGTGPIVEFLGSWTDFFGGRSGGFERKLEQAKDTCLDKLKAKAVQIGADAVIGIDLDYMNIASNMLMVVANGTAVRLQGSQ